MKKLILSVVLTGFWGAVFAAQAPDGDMPEPTNLPKQADAIKAVPSAKLTPAKLVYKTEKEAKKAFEARRKLIKKLVKKYHKASEAEKSAVKAELTAVVSQSMDEGLVLVKERIAAERANLERWSAKLAKEEKDFAAVKAQRVEDLLTGEAERKHKEMKKEWKKEMREAKNSMN